VEGKLCLPQAPAGLLILFIVGMQVLRGTGHKEKELHRARNQYNHATCNMAVAVWQQLLPFTVNLAAFNAQ
jgi:hypothetical protein